MINISQLHVHLYAPEPPAPLAPEERIEVYDRVIERLKAARKIAYQTEAVVDRICDKLETPDLEGEEVFSNQVEDMSGPNSHHFGPATCTVDRYIKDQPLKVGDKAVVTEDNAFSSLLRQGDEVTITEVVSRAGRVFYRVQGGSHPSVTWNVLPEHLNAPIN